MSVNAIAYLTNQIGSCVDVRSFAPPETPRDGSVPWDAFIQSAIDFIITRQNDLGSTGPVVATLYLPPGIYRIDRPLQISRTQTIMVNGSPVVQYAFCSIRITGGASGQSHQGASTIAPSFTDKPAIIVQWGKAVTLEKLSILGKNLWTEQPGRHPSLMATHYDEANYLYPDPQTIRDARHSPYAGVHVDPYSNPAPADAYPGLAAEYAKMPSSGGGQLSGSTGIQIRDCSIRGFTVGVAISLNGRTQNAENILVEDCVITSTKSAVAIGQSQSRNITLRNIVVFGAEHVVNCVDYGAGGGNCPAIFGGSVTGVKFLLKTISFGSTPSIHGLYCERILSLGVLGGGARDGHVFDACTFDFGPTPPGRAAPTYRLANLTLATFTGCTFTVDDAAGAGSAEPIWMLNLGWLSFNECKFTSSLADPSVYKSDRIWINGNLERVSFRNALMKVGGVESTLSNVLSVDFLSNFFNLRVVPGCLFHEALGDTRSLRWVASRYPAIDLGSGHTITVHSDGTATFTLPANPTYLRQIVRAGDFISTTSPLRPFGQDPSGPFGNPGVLFVMGKVRSVDVATGAVTLEFVPELVHETAMAQATPGQLQQQRLFARYWPKIHPRTIGDVTQANQVTITTPEAVGKWSVGDRLVGVDSSGKTLIPQGTYITAISGNVVTLSVTAAPVGVTVKLYDADVREVMTQQL